MTTIPAAWCPSRPPAERIARLLLNAQQPGDRYDLVADRDVRTALATSTPGSLLQDRIDQRAGRLAAETARVQAVVDYLAQMVGLAQVELEPFRAAG